MKSQMVELQTPSLIAWMSAGSNPIVPIMETGAEKASAKDGIHFFEVLYIASPWNGSLPCSILNMARSSCNNRAMSITSLRDGVLIVGLF